MAARGAPQVSTGIVPASNRVRIGPAGPPAEPVLHPGVVPQRGGPGIISTPTMTPVPLIPPPPYSVSMVMPPASEMPVEQAENTCLSPSQFLYHPTALRSVSGVPSSTTSPAVVTSAIATTSDSVATRQPVCSSSITTTSSAPGKENTKTSVKSKRAKILKAYKGKMSSLKLKYDLQLKEKFFLEGGGNMMEFLSWKKKPNILRDQYLEQNRLEAGETAASQDHLLSPKDITHTFIASRLPTEEVLKETMKQPTTPKEPKSSDTFKTPITTAPTTSASSTTIQIPLSTVSPGLQAGTPKPPTPSSPLKGGQFHTPSPRPVTRTQTSFSSVYESSHEDIVMRARHEADVKKAIAELRREGLWSACRLPKVVEPSRKKTHWDYLLEEMHWLATDFVNERRWKVNAARKVSDSHGYSLCLSVWTPLINAHQSCTVCMWVTRTLGFTHIV